MQIQTQIFKVVSKVFDKKNKELENLEKGYLRGVEHPLLLRVKALLQPAVSRHNCQLGLQVLVHRPEHRYV
jgi:hypothetical protein